MRQVSPCLWVGNAGDVRDPRGLLAADICVLIDLAIDEPFPSLPRALAYCRFPLVDATGNANGLLEVAIATTASFLRHGIATLVCCGHGMSRAPAIAAAALSLNSGELPDHCLAQVARSGPSDVTPGLWRDVRAALALLLSPASCRP